MLELFSKITQLRNEFLKNYSGTSHIQEVIPSNSTDFVDSKYLKYLHKFANCNPIYYNSYNQIIGDVPCTVYEGDFNKFWLNSIKHSSSNAPFSPTWIISAFCLAKIVKHMGSTEIIDIGSGDGRIAFFGSVMSMKSFSFEIDGSLACLQKYLSRKTQQNFSSFCIDAKQADFSKLDLNNPAFFIGGLAQMGGEILADSVIQKIDQLSVKQNSILVFAGTYSPKYPVDKYGCAGWGNIIKKYNFELLDTVLLPTVWTFKEPDLTPYLFAKFA